MKLGATTIPGGHFTSIAPTAKQVIHRPDWSDEVQVTDMGAGPTIINVAGIAMTKAERLAVNTACEAARTADTKLYFSSEIGQTDDYYYLVRTGPMRPLPRSSTVYEFSFTAIALVPWIYATATNLRVT